MASSTDTKVSIIIGITDDIIDKFDARLFIDIASKTIGGHGGGGRKDLAQAGGKDKTKVQEMFVAIKAKIKKIS